MSDSHEGAPMVDGEPVTAERLQHDLSFDSDAMPEDDPGTDEDALVADGDPSEEDAQGSQEP
ncbi:MULTISPECIES: hypothetical protein [unclassified Curtobacterium]|uniref:hypothetical protein n=2 Tax=Curtobacterium TaxID=2034 RepID=UPI0011B4040F|nr:MULTISPECIES: hypothetical protein [unclassified Curtobacterium]